MAEARKPITERPVLRVRAVGGDAEPHDELIAVLFGQQAVQREQEDRPVRPPQCAGDDAGHVAAASTYSSFRQRLP